MKTVTIQDVRFDFKRVREILLRGEDLVLTYRNRPLARILPFATKPDGDKDPALSFADQADDIEPMSNRDMDSSIYG